jgi:hypothetical protein
MSFNMDLFRKKNQENSENNPFSEVDNGVYILDLIRSEMNFAKNSGRYQAMFQWKIDPDANDRCKNQNVFVFCGLKDKDGNDDEKGYGALDIILSTLGINDRFEFVSNLEENMPKLEGTRVRMKIEDNKKNPQFKQYRVERLIKNVWKERNQSGNAPPQQTQNPVSQAVNYDNKPFTNINGVTLEKDAKVTVRRKDGQALGKVLSLVPDHQQALVQYENTDLPTEVVAYDDLFVWVAPLTQTETTPIAPTAQTVEILEIAQPEQPKQVKLEVGMNVRGKWGDQIVTGLVHKIDEDTQQVVIAGKDPNDGKVKGYPVPASTVELIA